MSAPPFSIISARKGLRKFGYSAAVAFERIPESIKGGVDVRIIASFPLLFSIRLGANRSEAGRM
jgi:hypothetical protein